MLLTNLRQSWERKKGQKDLLQTQINSTKEKTVHLKRELRYSEQAQAIIQQVARETQEKLQYHISELCSLALSAVFDDPYELELEFVLRRDKTEADIYFVKDEERIDPISASGGGVIDIASFALRVALWSLARPRSRNTLVLDEAFKHLKGLEENKKVIQMIKMLSEKLELQIIMVHDERVPLTEIEKGVDRIFSVTKPRKYSIVEKIK